MQGYLLLIFSFLFWLNLIAQTPPCGNDYGSSSDEADIINQMRYGTISDVVNSINQAKNTRGNSLGCPQEVVIYQTPDFTEPLLSEIENSWLTVHKPAIEAITISCPKIGRYESNAVLGAYYAMLAGYSVDLSVLADAGEMMTAQQYSASNLVTVLPEHEGVFGYIHVGSLNPCYPGGIVGTSVDDVCSNAPSLCVTYDFGNFNGEEFLIGDQYAPLNFYDGGLAYDHGWVGIHMIEAAIQQNDSVLKSKFKNSAVLAAYWAANEYAVKNHNYTAKLIWLLAELYAWSGQTFYKDALNEKLERNLIPGILFDSTGDGFVDGTSPAIAFSSLHSAAQTPGRMWDGHNSLPWYNAMNAWAMTEAYVAFRDQGETLRAAELKPYVIAMLDNLANEVSTLGVIDPSYLGVRDLAYAFLIGIWKVARYENESHTNWEDAAWAIWNTGAFNAFNTNSVCVGLYLLIQTDTPYEPLASRQDFNSIGEYEAIGGIQVFPNPANESIKIKFNKSAGETAEIKIYNTAGKLVYSIATNASENGLDVSSFEAGVYIVKVKTGDEIQSTRFVIK